MRTFTFSLAFASLLCSVIPAACAGDCALIDAAAKTLATRPHAASVVFAPQYGGAGEYIFVNGFVYTVVNGTVSAFPFTDHDNVPVDADPGRACEKIKTMSIDGNAVSLIAVRFGDTAASTQNWWIADATGLPLKREDRNGTGFISSQTYRLDDIKEPPGAYMARIKTYVFMSFLGIKPSR